MTKTLLSLHVLAAIVAIGPVTVAASMFPGVLRRADPSATPVLRNLHRICRVYAGLGILVPLFGLATASSLGVLGDTWLIASMILTAAAALILAMIILPRQAEALVSGPPASGPPASGPPASGPPASGPPASGSAGSVAARLGMATGIFNLLWATVVVLMIIRPGSTTGA